LPKKDVIEVERTVTAPLAPMPNTIADGLEDPLCGDGLGSGDRPPPRSPEALRPRLERQPAGYDRAGARSSSGGPGAITVELDGDVHDEHEWDKTLTAYFDSLILAPSMSFRVLLTTRLIG
jgi:hypothetical protein